MSGACASASLPNELGDRHTPGARYGSLRGGVSMRYMLAWLLGVPGIVILLWFLFAHLR